MNHDETKKQRIKKQSGQNYRIDTKKTGKTFGSKNLVDPVNPVRYSSLRRSFVVHQIPKIDFSAVKNAQASWDWAMEESSGGGTRTPDTRIMIPLL